MFLGKIQDGDVIAGKEKRRLWSPLLICLRHLLMDGSILGWVTWIAVHHIRPLSESYQLGVVEVLMNGTLYQSKCPLQESWQQVLAVFTLFPTSHSDSDYPPASKLHHWIRLYNEGRWAKCKSNKENRSYHVSPLMGSEAQLGEPIVGGGPGGGHVDMVGGIR
ncbi:hypothetical protein H6P81_015816 [Aristolochia fimbriata]|uniref:Uncharacterized protein n=1 Tax=Aristolochia fimbriata TaxID=158543 RepID=A0AAV7E9H2_ARIFI|nr:hypothetical protein H6P81_015816 [Aristolochia fimbriata]